MSKGWVLASGFVLATGCSSTELDFNNPDVDELSDEDKTYIDGYNSSQDTEIGDTKTRVEDLEAQISELFPVAAWDAKLSPTTVSAVFGTPNPAVPGEPERKNPGAYISAEQAIAHLAGRISGGAANTTSTSSTSSTNGGNPPADNVSYNPSAAGTGTQTFETATSVEDAINALRWASQILISPAGTTWAGTPTNTVQEALENLDDRTAVLEAISSGSTNGTSGGTVTVDQVLYNATNGNFGAGTNPWIDNADAYPDISTATNVKQAINALRFVDTTNTFFAQSGNALTQGYVSEAIRALDARAHQFEEFIIALQGSSGGGTVGAAGVTISPASLTIFNGADRGNQNYNLPLEGTTLQTVVDELQLIVNNYRYADKIKIDFSRAPLSNSRWVPGTTVAGGAYALPGGDVTPYLDLLLGEVNDEFNDIQADVADLTTQLADLTTIVNNVLDGSGGLTVSAAQVTYSPTTANSALTFGGSTNVEEALGALRYSTNVRFDPTDATLQAGFDTSAIYVQAAIVAAYNLNKIAIDTLTATVNSLNTTLPQDTTFISVLVNSLSTDTAFNTYIENVISDYIVNNAIQTDASLVTFTSQTGLVGTNVRAALDEVNTKVNNLDTEVDNIRGVDTDAVFFNNLVTKLSANTTFLTNVANNNTFITQLSQNASFISNLTTQATFITAIETIIENYGAGGSGQILGFANDFDTGLVYNLRPGLDLEVADNGETLTGLRAAGKHCRTTFNSATAHMCTVSEVAAGVSKLNAGTAANTALIAALAGNAFWVHPTAQTDIRNNTCRDWLYNSAHIGAAGLSGVLTLESNVGGNSSSGYTLQLAATACTQNRRLICCD